MELVLLINQLILPLQEGKILFLFYIYFYFIRKSIMKLVTPKLPNNQDKSQDRSQFLPWQLDRNIFSFPGRSTQSASFVIRNIDLLFELIGINLLLWYFCAKWKNINTTKNPPLISNFKIGTQKQHNNNISLFSQKNSPNFELLSSEQPDFLAQQYNQNKGGTLEQFVHRRQSSSIYSVSAKKKSGHAHSIVLFNPDTGFLFYLHYLPDHPIVVLQLL